MKNKIVAGTLHIERETGLKPVFPIDIHAQKVDIKIPGFVFIKNSDDRYDLKVRSREVPEKKVLASIF